MPVTIAAAKATVPQVQEESFTIYIGATPEPTISTCFIFRGSGAQMKTMHNARVLRCDRLTDLCQTPLGEAPHSADSELFDSRRLQLLMSLYGSNLTSVVLLVGRDPLYHLLNRTLFARMCEHSAELHFDSLEQQLQAIAKEVCTPMRNGFMPSSLRYPGRSIIVADAAAPHPLKTTQRPLPAPTTKECSSRATSTSPATPTLLAYRYDSYLKSWRNP